MIVIIPNHDEFTFSIGQDDLRKQLNEVKKIIDNKEKNAKLAQSANILLQAEELLKKYDSAVFMVEALNADSNTKVISCT